MSSRPTVVGHDLPPDVTEAIRRMGVDIEFNGRGAPRAAGRVLVVVSPKGGSGKTAVTSNLAVALSQRHPGRVVAVDLDLSLIEGAAPNLEVREGDIVAGPVEPGGFDLVTARAVLHHVADADAAGIRSGDLVEAASSVSSVRAIAAVSSAPRRGVIVCEHGWGSATLDPRGGEPPDRHGTNRNELVDRQVIDPLSQVPRLNGQPVRITRI